MGSARWLGQSIGVGHARREKEVVLGLPEWAAELEGGSWPLGIGRGEGKGAAWDLAGPRGKASLLGQKRERGVRFYFFSFTSKPFFYFICKSNLNHFKFSIKTTQPNK